MRLSSPAALLLALILAVSDSAAAGDITVNLIKKLSVMNSLSGQFQQRTYADDGEWIEDSTGVFSLMRPGYFYWHVQQPGRQILVSDGSQIWDYDLDLEQIIQREINWDDEASSLVAMISGREKQLKKYYRVEELEDENSFRLSPLKNGSAFTTIELSFQDDTLSIIRLRDPLGQTTEIRFIETKLNISLDKTVFDFTPPEHVDLIRHSTSGGWQ